MAATCWILLLVLLVQLSSGDLYENSYISPNSAGDKVLLQSEEHLVDVTSGPSEVIFEEIETRRVERAANPILSKPTSESVFSSKNILENFDSNDVELSGRVADFIQPSKTFKEDAFQDVQSTSHIDISGEIHGTPQGRSLVLSESQHISPTATTTMNSASLSPEAGQPRQSNPDIQDIITGIVKLLNGNVNVQANTAPSMGRPLRPLSTRINNRGPPRITDVPALPPDFDIPASQLPPAPIGQMPPPLVTPTKTPTPYPFDLPPQNTSPIRPYLPISEGIGRPSLYRPVSIPPWTRPNSPMRRPPNRRPKPPFKPIPLFTGPTTEKTVAMGDEDILTLDLGSELQSTYDTINDSYELNESNSEISISTGLPERLLEEQENLDYEKNKEKTLSKMEKHTTTKILDVSATSTDSSSIITEAINSSILPSPVLSVLSTVLENATQILDNITSSEVALTSTTILESSIEEVTASFKDETFGSSTLTSTATETLPLSLSSVIGSIEKVLINTQTPINLPSGLPNGTEKDFPYFPYRPRPGIVLDDTEYKPGGGIHRPPIITPRPSIGSIGDIFDVTVSAIQGLGGENNGKPVDPSPLQTPEVITSPIGDEGFVSIDGKRTYLNLFGEATAQPSQQSHSITPSTPTTFPVTGTGYAVVDVEKSKPHDNIPAHTKPTPRRPLYGRRPSQPPVRIDTCIVGDDSTCDTSQHEVCKTEAGVSACHCSPGHARRKHRDPCRKIVSMVLSLRVDRMNERRIIWVNELSNKHSESYQQLSYETERAMESAMSMTPFSDEFLGAKVLDVYRGDRSAGQAGVFVNLTLQLEANSDTSRPAIRGEIQKHLLGVIQRRSNNVGNSALWVDSPPGSVSHLQDLDECSSSHLHNCHALAKCINVFGTFTCECGEGLRDPWADNKHRAGRQCEQCSPQYCNNRGECKYQNGQEVCICSGSYYGTQCEVDGEILGVAIGASVAAVIIIGLTLVCLVMWSRKWNKEQKAGVGSPVFGYMTGGGSTVKTPVVGGPPYQVSMEDRIRWAQIADVMAQSNHYGPEPATGQNRPPSGMFGYPNLSVASTLQRGTFQGTLPPIPLPRLGLQAQLAARAASVQGMRPLDNSSSSEEEDRTDLLGRNFQVPRPKSRSNASIANQSGIYYDVDYDQHDIYKQGTIPMSTYAMGRPFYRS